MNRRNIALLNLGFVFLAIAGSVATTVRRPQEESAPTEQSAVSDSAFLTRVVHGRTEVRDMSGRWLELRNFDRIASGSTIADELLLEFCEPERIVAFTRFSQENEFRAHQFAGRPHLSALDDLETLIALRPDLLLLNTLGSGTKVSRLRDAGIVVFDLGEMRGVAGFVDNARVIAKLVGRPALGERYAKQFQARLERVAAEVPQKDRIDAAYVSVFGTNVYGGGRNTSYDDVLRYAGLENALAAEYQGWPDLSVEELLGLDPALIVTHTGMRQSLCQLSGLAALKACRHPTRSVVELSPSILSDPGSGMLIAAEMLHERVNALAKER